ncbi:hypothetical protein AB1E18_018687 [Capra hircus]
MGERPEKAHSGGRRCEMEPQRVALPKVAELGSREEQLRHHNHRKCSCPRAASVHCCHPEPGSSLVPYTCPVPGCDPVAAYLHLLLQEGHQGATISPESKKTMPCTDHSDCLPL